MSNKEEKGEEEEKKKEKEKQNHKDKEEGCIGKNEVKCE